ncbi:MAG: HEAT repeat domain-containing protein [Thermoguttaceae bacterium]
MSVYFAFCLVCAAVPDWAGELSDRNLTVRWHAACAAGEAGPKAGAAVQPLMKVLANMGEDEYVRGTAAWALGRIGPAAKPALPLLIRVLTSKHVSVRRNAALALGNFGPEAQSATDPLVKMLEDEDSVVRVNAAAALWKIARHEKALPALVATLESRETGSFEAAVALGQLGPDAAPAIPSLAATFHLPDDDLCRAAIRSLASICAKSAAPLLAALDDPEPRVRSSAARALGLLGTRDADARLLKAASDPDAQVRQTAAWALARVRSKK